MGKMGTPGPYGGVGGFGGMGGLGKLGKSVLQNATYDQNDDTTFSTGIKMMTLLQNALCCKMLHMPI